MDKGKKNFKCIDDSCGWVGEQENTIIYECTDGEYILFCPKCNEIVEKVVKNG